MLHHLKLPNRCGIDTTISSSAELKMSKNQRNKKPTDRIVLSVGF